MDGEMVDFLTSGQSVRVEARVILGWSQFYLS